MSGPSLFHVKRTARTSGGPLPWGALPRRGMRRRGADTGGEGQGWMGRAGNTQEWGPSAAGGTSGDGRARSRTARDGQAIHAGRECSRGGGSCGGHGSASAAHPVCALEASARRRCPAKLDRTAGCLHREPGHCSPERRRSRSVVKKGRRRRTRGLQDGSGPNPIHHHRRRRCRSHE